jgi:hypothetical protein
MINVKFLHTIIDEAIDDSVFKKLNHEQFFIIIEKAEIDLDKLASKRKKNDYIPYHRFNFILKELHNSEEVNIADACVYILTQTLLLKDLMGCLNEENAYTLRTALAKRYNIKIRQSSLDSYTFKRKKVQKI